jgi:hypothetical protein
MLETVATQAARNSRFGISVCAVEINVVIANKNKRINRIRKQR